MLSPDTDVGKTSALFTSTLGLCQRQQPGAAQRPDSPPAQPRPAPLQCASPPHRAACSSVQLCPADQAAAHGLERTAQPRKRLQAHPGLLQAGTALTQSPGSLLLILQLPLPYPGWIQVDLAHPEHPGCFPCLNLQFPWVQVPLRPALAGGLLSQRPRRLSALMLRLL